MKNTLLIVLLIALGASVFTCHYKADQLAPPEVRDTTTVTVHDTITHERVQWKTRYLMHYDTLTHKVNDTLIVRVPVPISRHLFTDDTTYLAEVSGYGVSLDKIEVYQKTVFRNIEIVKPVRPKRFGVGVQVGYGITPTGKPQPYISIGISYNFLRF